MRRKNAPKPQQDGIVQYTSKVEPDERGYCQFFIELDDKTKVHLQIPFKLKVKEVFTLFDNKYDISWVSHAIVVDNKILWYDNYLYQYADLLHQNAVAYIVEDKGESFYQLIKYYIVKYYKHFLKRLGIYLYWKPPSTEAQPDVK